MVLLEFDTCVLCIGAGLVGLLGPTSLSDDSLTMTFTTFRVASVLPETLVS